MSDNEDLEYLIKNKEDDYEAPTAENPPPADDDTSQKPEEEEDLSTCSVMIKLMKFAIFPIMATIFHPLYVVVNSVALGRTDKTMLAAYGLGSLTTGIFLISVGYSFAMSIGTLVSQAHGAKDRRLCRLYLHRSFYLNTWVWLLLCIPMVSIRHIYKWIGQDEEIAKLASQYVWIVLPGTYFFFQSTSAMGFCQSQKELMFGVYAMAGSAISHVIMVIVFNKLEMGFTGIALATSIHFFIRFVISMLCITYSGKFDDTRDMRIFSIESTQDLGNQIKMSLASLAMCVWGWWALDIFTLIATYLSQEIIAAQTIMRCIGLVTFMIPVGFSYACVFYMGQFIGKNNIPAVKKYFVVTMQLAVIIGLVQVLILWSLEKQMIKLFTTLPEVSAQMHKCWPIFLVFVLFDTTQGNGQAAIRASGKQKWGAIVTFSSYWGLGIPIVCLLVFKADWGIVGIWLGPTIAYVYNTVAYIVIFNCINWPELIEEAAKKRAQDKGK